MQDFAMCYQPAGSSQSHEMGQQDVLVLFGMKLGLEV
jgi:hypothetical protein